MELNTPFEIIVECGRQHQQVRVDKLKYNGYVMKLEMLHENKTLVLFLKTQLLIVTVYKMCKRTFSKVCVMGQSSLQEI